jgi:hypothetical protein
LQFTKPFYLSSFDVGLQTNNEFFSVPVTHNNSFDSGSVSVVSAMSTSAAPLPDPVSSNPEPIMSNWNASQQDPPVWMAAPQLNTMLPSSAAPPPPPVWIADTQAHPTLFSKAAPPREVSLDRVPHSFETGALIQMNAMSVMSAPGYLEINEQHVAMHHGALCDDLICASLLQPAVEIQPSVDPNDGSMTNAVPFKTTDVAFHAVTTKETSQTLNEHHGSAHNQSVPHDPSNHVDVLNTHVLPSNATAFAIVNQNTKMVRKTQPRRNWTMSSNASLHDTSGHQVLRNDNFLQLDFLSHETETGDDISVFTSSTGASTMRTYGEVFSQGRSITTQDRKRRSRASAMEIEHASKKQYEPNHIMETEPSS